MLKGRRIIAGGSFVVGSLSSNSSFKHRTLRPRDMYVGI